MLHLRMVMELQHRDLRQTELMVAYTISRDEFLMGFVDSTRIIGAL